MQVAYWGHAEAVEELERLAGLAGKEQSRVPDCVVLAESPVPWDAKHEDVYGPTEDPKSVSIICSAPEFSHCGDKVMVGLFLICDAFGEHIKFGYDWGGSVTAEPADKNPDRVVWDCCHSLACTVGSGAGQCAVRGKPLRGPVDWSNPKSVAGSMWFPKYKTMVLGAIQAEAQRQGIEWIEMIVRCSSLISHHLSCQTIRKYVPPLSFLDILGCDRPLEITLGPQDQKLKISLWIHHQRAEETVEKIIPPLPQGIERMAAGRIVQ
jgi:hypothetical protein